jgi:hypothetical protein
MMPEMQSIATHFMPEEVSDLSCSFDKMIESCPQVASQFLWQPHLPGHPSEA